MNHQTKELLEMMETADSAVDPLEIAKGVVASLPRTEAWLIQCVEWTGPSKDAVEPGRAASTRTVSFFTQLGLKMAFHRLALYQKEFNRYYYPVTAAAFMPVSVSPLPFGMKRAVQALGTVEIIEELVIHREGTATGNL